MTDNYEDNARAEAAMASRPMTSMELREQAHRMAREAEALRTQAAEMDRAAEEARRPKMPEVTTDTSPVVTFSKWMNGVDYRFAAVGFRKGAQVRWMVTGAETRRFTWSGLLSWIGEANWSTMVHLTGGHGIGPLPGSADEPAVAEEMGPFGRVKSTEAVRDYPPGGYGRIRL